MTIVAHNHPYVIGVDTHARNHVLAILAATGQPIDSAEFPTTKAGMARAIAWAARRTGGNLAALWAVEGVATYGAQLAAAIAESGYQVVEAPQMNARVHRGVGKSDPLDARRIAEAALPLEETQLRHPRSDEGERAALRVLVTARDHMTGERIATINALTALSHWPEQPLEPRPRAWPTVSWHSTTNSPPTKRQSPPSYAPPSRRPAREDRNRTRYRGRLPDRLVTPRQDSFRSGVRLSGRGQPHPRLVGQHRPSSP
ncbi:hypothetical protein IFM12275_24520 [Nocardia sputorum]|nr:hypothetical protein IFM12275_24520 [Nocardia sputorum]